MSKKWFVSAVFMVMVLASQAQFRKIPAVVTDAFKAKYAAASGVSWRDKLSSFQADFTINSRVNEIYIFLKR